ncbi:hypothetical protein [Dongshaea marina]|uniref:hypothetical protein n=1 Tax=Dongshaea marina TaxID=2047966 RepID=UPI000D3E0327|nr:hypothetical protein [Dongshaea marina]
MRKSFVISGMLFISLGVSAKQNIIQPELSSGAVQYAANTSPDCPGTATPPDSLEEHFQSEPTQKVPADALGKEGEGNLCQGEVYKVIEDTTVYRAWNSSYQGSKLGKWWSFDKPSGETRQYRLDNALCPSFSPIDMLETCTLKAGADVVIGTGQSAMCSKYSTYPASSVKQVYISPDEVSNAVAHCKISVSQLSWKMTPIETSVYHLQIGDGKAGLEGQVCGKDINSDTSSHPNLSADINFPQSGSCHVYLTSPTFVSFDINQPQVGQKLKVTNCSGDTCSQINTTPNSVMLPNVG